MIGRELRSAIAKRRKATDRRLESFGKALHQALRGDAAAVLGNHTCVYSVGSGGRGELTAQSDLDLFLVRVGKKGSGLDAVLLQAAIVKASRRARFPDPSGDGEWLTMHSADRFSELLGSPADDTENTFTARMLLLLESRPVAGERAYRRLVDQVIDRYWQDAGGHPKDYQPILLVNDIVRYWRILLLNYEARIRRPAPAMDDRSREADRRLRSYKLGFSRCLTCYSALLYLLALTHGTATPHVGKRDVREMIALSPLERLVFVGQRAAEVDGVAPLVDRLIRRYLEFLEVVEAGKSVLRKGFMRKAFSAERSQEKREFGQAMFALVSCLGRDNALMRWIVV